MSETHDHDENNRCQFCSETVAWGMTEHGYKGFVHESNRKSECPK